MTQTTCAAGCMQCQQCARAATDDVADAARYVSAGDACGSDCAGFETPEDPTFAGLYFQPQTYRTGFCPTEALAKGTLFPELVSPYIRGC